jgi:mannan endo-1,4-beta-mannosidase
MLRKGLAGVFLAVLVVTGVSPLFREGLVSALQDSPLPTYQGYISVAPGGRYFVDEAGQGFLVIGQNDGVPWPGLSALLNRSAPQATEAYIADLRAHGITVSRVMVEYAQEPHTYLENPVGVFSPSMVQFWDDFIALAEQHGLYLLLTPYDTFWQSHNWAGYPYNADAGGPCVTRRDWLTGRACIEAQKNRWRFILEHWGGSPNIFAWDLMNEIDIWWEATSDEISAYIDEMAAFVREVEMERWGRTHLITVSSAASVPEGGLGRAIYRHTALDFANTHLYLGPAIKDPQNPIEAGPMMGGGVLRSLQSIRDDRPYFDSESGPIDDWIGDVDFDREYHHNMSWGHLAAGGAGSGMRWPYTNPHWILPELRDNLLGLARFAATIDWAHFPSRNINDDIRLDRPDIFRIGCSDGRTAVVWLLRDTRQEDAPTLPGVTLTLDGVLQDGAYTVEFWETYVGTRLESVTAQAEGGMLAVTIPALDPALKDIAIIVRPNLAP